MDFIVSLITNPAGLLASLAAVVALIGGVYAKGRIDEGRKQKAKIERERQRARDVGQKIDDAVAGNDPDKNRQELDAWLKD